MPEQLDTARVLDADRFAEYEDVLSRGWMIDRIVERMDRPGLRICDVGGARGRFLQEVAEKATHPFEGTILEVDESYRERVVSPDFAFVHGSVVDNDLPEASFDFVTFQHVLHHMVSDTLAHSRALQEESLAAMLRLTKPGGFLIFEEQTNRVAPFARLVYLLSRAANSADLRWRFFDVGGVVVSYLTPGEIRAWVERERARGRLEVESEEFTPWDMPWRWKLTLLMAWTGASGWVLRRADGGASTAPDHSSR
jgi:ubiquinone/menaquinone biosynthesis C-methylase UbiE